MNRVLYSESSVHSTLINEFEHIRSTLEPKLVDFSEMLRYESVEQEESANVPRDQI